MGRNTAIMELKLFAMIMGEAVRLGHADANPLVSLKLRRDKSARKPELTDKEITDIRHALRIEPEWMQAAFDISLHTGCRLRETRNFRSIARLYREQKSLSHRPKAVKIGHFPFQSLSRPAAFLNRIVKSGRKFTARVSLPTSRRWQQFFIKIDDATFMLSLPSSYLRQPVEWQGVPARSRQTVNHSSELVHQVYQRERVDDVAQCDAVELLTDSAGE